MTKDLHIIGAGGLGREMLATFRNCEFDKNYDHIFFIDSKQEVIDGIEIIGNNEYLISLNSNVDVIIALSNISVRHNIINAMSHLDFLNFITFFHPRSSIYDNDIVIGKGCYIAENCVISTNIQIGDFS
jgi:acetyltransferase-like isoleucine patch superfamily enzyme